MSDNSVDELLSAPHVVERKYPVTFSADGESVRQTFWMICFVLVPSVELN